MQTSIIIVTYNSEKTIEICLELLIAQTGTEILVIDNASTDDTLAIVKKFPRVKLIANSGNLGFGTANNIGVKSSDSDYLFFLNPDTKIDSNTIKKLSEYLDKNLGTAVVGPKLLNQNGTLQKEMAKFPTLVSQILILLRLHRIGLQKLVYPNFDYEKTQEAEHLMGAALMIRRAVFDEVGGFDENFFLWFEETDLLKRIKDKGYKIIYYPETAVTHLVGQSTQQINFLKKQTIWNKSLLYYFKKHKGWVKLLLLLPFILLSYPAALVSYLIKKH